MITRDLDIDCKNTLKIYRGKLSGYEVNVLHMISNAFFNKENCAEKYIKEATRIIKKYQGDH